MKPLSATLLLAWACSILLLGPDVFVAAKKKKKSPSPKLPKMFYGKAKKQKQGQCLKSDDLEARATAVKNELSGDYIVCSFESFVTLYINGSFVEFPFFADDEPEITTIRYFRAVDEGRARGETRETIADCRSRGKEFSTTISTPLTLTDFSTSKYSQRVSNSLVVL